MVAVEAAPAVPVHGGGGGARGGGVQTARTTSLVTSLQDDGGVILTLGRPVGPVVAGGGPAELEAVRVRGLCPAYPAVARLPPETRDCLSGVGPSPPPSHRSCSPGLTGARRWKKCRS